MGSVFRNLFGRKTPPGRERLEALYASATQASTARNLTEAIRLYDEVITLDPAWAEPYYKRANALKDLGRLEAAVTSYTEAIARKSDYTHAYCNRGVVLLGLGQSAEALASLKRATELEPTDFVSHYNQALCHQARCEWREALTSYDRAIQANPNYADAQYNRAVLLLYCGEFQEGWRAYEWRWRNAERLGIGAVRTYAQPLWLGSESIAHKDLYLHAEAGLGDTLQFCRYATLCAQQGARVILEVPASLVELVSTLDGVSRVIPAGSSPPAFDYHCPLMSLPLAFKTTADTVPGATKYLRAGEAQLTEWRNRLGPATRPRIGLTWSGNPRNPIDAKRSIRLAEFLAYLPAHYDFYCLQTEIREADRATLNDCKSMVSFNTEISSFADTAAFCACMDLIITVDTSVAHLCGAMGLKTWLLLAHVPDWRWMREGEDTPWYASMHLYRQAAAGEWRAPFERIAKDLQNTFATRT